MGWTQVVDEPMVVRAEVEVALGQAAAFELFTAGMSRWWPFTGHSIHEAQSASVEVEPRVGGQVVEHASDGRRAPWGTILAWEPPRRFAMSWHPGFDPVGATRLEVSFTAVAGGGTRVEVLHTGWEARGEVAADRAESYRSGWPRVLAQFAAAAARS